MTVETIALVVNDTQSQAGDVLNIDSDSIAGVTVTNNSGIAVEYSTGGAWTTIASGASATISGAIATDALRFRKKTGDAYPAQLSAVVTHPGYVPAQLATDAAGKVLGLRTSYGAFPSHGCGNIGTRIFGGRMGTFDNTTQQTFHVVFTLAQHFDAVRLIFANGTTGTATVGVAKVSPLSDLSTASNQNNSSGTWYSVTFGGSATGTIPAAAGASFRRNYLLSDWISVSSLDRVDGGAFPALAVRAYISTSGTIGVVGNGADNFTNWATKPDGRIHIMRNQAGDQVTAPAGFSSTTNASQSPIVGVQYAARGRVITVMGIGDSITEGRGTYIGDGFGMQACAAISDINGVAVEWANCGWSGADPTKILNAGLDALAYFSPDIVVLPNGTPNVSAAPLTTTGIRMSRQMLYRLLAECQTKRVIPVIWTWLPTNDTVKAWNSSDALRRAWDDDVRKLASSRGMLVVDADAVLAGEANGSGQVQMLAGSTTDGIHPNDTGNALLASAFKSAFAELSA